MRNILLAIYFLNLKVLLVIQLSLLCTLIIINAKIANSRGRKGGMFAFLTFVLWVVFGLLGAFLAYMVSGGKMQPILITATVFAIIGGIISYLIARNCTTGDYIALEGDKLLLASPLDTPVTLTIQREKSSLSKFVPYSVSLNGVEIGDLKNGESIQSSTNLVENGMSVVSQQGIDLKPFYFIVKAGTNALITFNSSRFMPELCRGIHLLNDDEARELSKHLENNKESES
ncbi:MAG: hypothetical protein LBD17_03995 [Endomicrobium sp.]|jgi:hypothetical protein|nr:hypothetical protein [Endomicrobium sp.]